MPWPFWAAVGIALGWWCEVLFGRCTPSARLRSLLFFGALIGTLLLAGVHYFFYLPSGIYALEGFLLRPQMLTLVGWAVIGFVASRYRASMRERADQFYRALLGTESNSAWALQSAVALLALLGIIVLLEPRVLERLESFKAGDVEAKFTSVSATTREAVRNIYLAQLVTDTDHRFASWINFKDIFMLNREEVNRELDKSSIKKERLAIRDEILKYLNPVAILINCFEKHDNLTLLRRDDSINRITVALSNAILHEDGSGKSLTMTNGSPRFIGILVELGDRAASLFESELRPYLTEADWRRCESISEYQVQRDSIAPKKSDYSALNEQLGSAVNKLREDAERKYDLSFIDPYISSFVGDLSNRVLGYDAEVKFLLRVKGRYPSADRLVQPGIINLYSQLAGAKLRTDAVWPLDESIEEHELALTLTNYVIANTTKSAVRDTYYPVKFAILRRYIDLYNQTSLAGYPITAERRARWAALYGEAESALNLRSGRHVRLAAAEPEASVTGLTANEIAAWAKADIPPGGLFTASISLALSSVLLSERDGSARNQSCAIARMWLQDARHHLANYTKTQGVDQDRAITARFDGFFQQVEARIAASC